MTQFEFPIAGGSLVSGRGNFRPGFYGQGGSAMYLNAFKVRIFGALCVRICLAWIKELNLEFFLHIFSRIFTKFGCFCYSLP
jgi:hypothetical protein